MTPIQIEYLSEMFFKPQDESQFAGWKSIATNLLTKGSVIIPSHYNTLWAGGVGNFMRYDEISDGVDVQRLVFDTDGFLKWKSIEVNVPREIKKLSEEIKQKENKIKALKISITHLNSLLQ